jgi:hypothetical protein
MVMTIQALHFALGWFTTQSNVNLFSLMAIFSIFVLVALIKRVIFVKRINRIPGLPCGITIIGNAPTFLVPPEGKLLKIQFGN